MNIERMGKNYEEMDSECNNYHCPHGNHLYGVLENRMDFVMERGCYLIWDCGCGNSNKYIDYIYQNQDSQKIKRGFL